VNVYELFGGGVKSWCACGLWSVRVISILVGSTELC
jgi:hypothetical protein